jgi:acetyl esterase/lipase
MVRNSRSVLDRPAPPPAFGLPYGDHPEQVADVWLPPGSGPAPLVLLIHGGFWRQAYDRSHLAPLASALAPEGFVVTTIEFRRTGGAGGWPATFDDVAAAVARLPEAIAARLASRPTGLILSGHSAGGQLALWAAAGPMPDTGSAGPGGPGVPAAGLDRLGVVALAPVADLRAGYDLDLGGGAVADLLGGGPTEVPERYRAADPLSRVPLGCRVSVIHGTRDAIVPLSLSERFVAAARGTGDEAQLQAPDADHFDVIDPESSVWPVVLRSFVEIARASR